MCQRQRSYHQLGICAMRLLLFALVLIVVVDCLGDSIEGTPVVSRPTPIGAVGASKKVASRRRLTYPSPFHGGSSSRSARSYTHRAMVDGDIDPVIAALIVEQMHHRSMGPMNRRQNPVAGTGAQVPSLFAPHNTGSARNRVLTVVRKGSIDD